MIEISRLTEIQIVDCGSSLFNIQKNKNYNFTTVKRKYKIYLKKFSFNCSLMIYGGKFISNCYRIIRKGN